MPDLTEPAQTQQILTHVIDGFLIEESFAPFPNKSSFMTPDQLSAIRKRQQEILAQETTEQSDAATASSLSPLAAEEAYFDDSDFATCEQCAFYGPKSSFKSPNHRFCSLSCARRYATSYSTRKRSSSSALTSRRGRKFRSRSVFSKTRGNGRLTAKPAADFKRSPSNSVSGCSFSDNDDSLPLLSDDESVFSISPCQSPQPQLPCHNGATLRPVHWSVHDVWNFICSVSDSCQHADEFRSQEIDGSALLLLHEEHLVTSMNLPLGPALKLCAHIDRLRDRESP